MEVLLFGVARALMGVRHDVGPFGKRVYLRLESAFSVNLLLYPLYLGFAP